ncbi:MAG: hypothetical protein P8184_21560 [Calditrichia bacterium]
MTAYEIIAKKRDGKNLSDREIHFFIENLLKGEIKDYQMSALLMAIYLRHIFSPGIPLICQISRGRKLTNTAPGEWGTRFPWCWRRLPPVWM